MQDLPRLFDERGELINVDMSAFDAPTRARHAAIVSAFNANKQAESALTAAFAEVDRALAAVTNTEEFYKAHWPPDTFHDLWKQNFARR